MYEWRKQFQTVVDEIDHRVLRRAPSGGLQGRSPAADAAEGHSGGPVIEK